MNSKETVSFPTVAFEYKKLQKILTLDRRDFEPCQAKEVEQWSWKGLKNEKFLVHLKEYTNKWNIRKLT